MRGGAAHDLWRIVNGKKNAIMIQRYDLTSVVNHHGCDMDKGKLLSAAVVSTVETTTVETRNVGVCGCVCAMRTRALSSCVECVLWTTFILTIYVVVFLFACPPTPSHAHTRAHARAPRLAFLHLFC